MARTKSKNYTVDYYMDYVDSDEYDYENEKISKTLKKYVDNDEKYFDRQRHKMRSLNHMNPYGTSDFKRNTKTVKERKKNKKELNKYNKDPDNYEVMSNKHLTGKEYWW